MIHEYLELTIQRVIIPYRESLMIAWSPGALVDHVHCAVLLLRKLGMLKQLREISGSS